MLYCNRTYRSLQFQIIYMSTLQKEGLALMKVLSLYGMYVIDFLSVGTNVIQSFSFSLEIKTSFTLYTNALHQKQSQCRPICYSFIKEKNSSSQTLRLCLRITTEREEKSRTPLFVFSSEIVSSLEHLTVMHAAPAKSTPTHLLIQSFPQTKNDVGYQKIIRIRSM